MTDIEQKALALVNEVSRFKCERLTDAELHAVRYALCRAIARHKADKQAFAEERQRVSDAVSDALERCNYAVLEQFIIKPPVDPLVEALREVFPVSLGYIDAQNVSYLRAALSRHGLSIAKGER